MADIDRAGAYRGKVLEWSVNASANGFPQFQVKLSADEFYDETAGEWLPWTEYGIETMAYLVLFNAEKELLNVAQLRKALGWTGNTLASLNNGEWLNKAILYRVDSREYNGVTRLQVNWVDAADANPTKAVAKLDAGKFAALEAQFGARLAASAKAAAPAKAPAKPPVRPPAAKAPEPAQDALAGLGGEEAPALPAKRKPGRPPKKDAAPPAPAPATPAAGESGAKDHSALPSSTTKNAAWAAIVEVKDSAVTDDTLAEVWLAKIAAVGDGTPETEFTGEMWARVRDDVMAETAIF